MACSGNLPEHCCWVAGKPCKYLEENTLPDRRWVCSLRKELGSWEAVHNDPRYWADVKRIWMKHPFIKDHDCGDWPPPGHKCATCGVDG